MLAFDVNTAVVSEYAIVLSPVAATVKFTAVPSATEPRLPAAVVHVGASDTVRIAEDDRPALPSVFSTLIKYVPSVEIVKFATNVVELVNDTVSAVIILPFVPTASTLAPVKKLVPVIVIDV